MPNISRTKTWNANETLTAADLNAEFNGILTGVNDNTLNNDNLNQTDDYLFGSLVTGSGLAAGGGDGKLHVHVADVSGVTAHANGNDFVIEGTTNPGMSFLSGASTTNSIYFGDVDVNNAGSIVYNHSTPDMAFTVETVEVLTLAAASVTNNVNTFVGNGYGAVIGHTAQETISDGGGATDVVPEFQILGTAAADMTAMIGGWSTTATRAAAPVLALVKSGHASIGSHTVVTDGEILGSIIAYGDDGTDLEAPAAAIEFAVDGTPGTGDMPGEIKFYTTADSGETLTLALTLSAAQAATFAGAVTVASLACTAAGTFGGGYGDTGATISTAGVIQANGAITSDGAVTGATLAGTISTATQNSITTATSLASVGTITSGTWSGVIDGSCTMTLGSDATGDVYFRDASGFLEKLAASTDGHVLTSTGAGSIPAWEAIPSSGATLTGSTNNTVTTVTGANAFQGEANLTFDGTTLGVVGNAGIGIARTEGTLHVHTASAGTVDANANEDDLVVENSTHGGITILTPDANDSSLVFGSHTDAVGAVVRWNHDADLFRILTANAGASLTLETGAGSEAMRIDQNGKVQIKDTLTDSGNGNMTVGLTINQLSYDNEALVLKSSDIGHGHTSITETDTYLKISKYSATGGGAYIQSLAHHNQDTALGIESYGGAANATHSTGAIGLVAIHSAEHDSSGTQRAMTSNGMVFTIRCIDADSNNLCKFGVDEDGDIHYSGAHAEAHDIYEDAHICRAMVTTTLDPKTIVRSKWDKMVKYNKQTMVDIGVLGYCSPEEEAEGHNGLVNASQLQRVFMGAHWQAYCDRQEMKEELDELRQTNIKLASRLNLLEN